MNQKLSTESYKGVRDFYPADWQTEQHIFNVWRKTLQSFGYTEYNASILEPTELYKAKSGEEIVNEQTYSFVDRGGRDVTLRPEMTPTVARMVAARKRELSFPLRWFSIPNLFRYERPQRGRLREHWQLNADIFGIDGSMAEIELISIASALMKNFGLRDEQFEIRISSRRFLDAIFADWYEIDDERAKKLQKLIDRKNKMNGDEFQSQAEEIVGGAFNFLKLDPSDELYQEAMAVESIRDAKKEIDDIILSLENLGINNVRLDHELVRGFDYYTGIIFEIFDTDPENRRALFGGGRYDELLSLFADDSVPAAGFGMGDVTMRDTLETYGLLPEISSETTVYICTTAPTLSELAFALAKKMRAEGLNVGINLTDKKISDQIKHASKEEIPYIITIGETEAVKDIYPLKNLLTGDEMKRSILEIISILKQ
jgi:histidyl-tRNA synthetase